MNKILDNSFYLLEEKNGDKYIGLSTNEYISLGDGGIDDKKVNMVSFITKVVTTKNNFKSLNKVDYCMVDGDKEILLHKTVNIKYLGDYQELLIDYFGTKEKINKLKVPINLFEEFLKT